LAKTRRSLPQCDQFVLVLRYIWKVRRKLIDHISTLIFCDYHDMLISRHCFSLHKTYSKDIILLYRDIVNTIEHRHLNRVIIIIIRVASLVCNVCKKLLSRKQTFFGCYWKMGRATT